MARRGAQGATVPPLINRVFTARIFARRAREQDPFSDRIFVVGLAANIRAVNTGLQRSNHANASRLEPRVRRNAVDAAVQKNLATGDARIVFHIEFILNIKREEVINLTKLKTKDIITRQRE